MARDQTESRPSPHDCGSRIAALVSRWTDAWNAHDADALASLVAADVEFVNVAGRWLRGRHEFLEWHRGIHRGHLRDSWWTTWHHRTRLLGRHLTLVHLEWTINGEYAADGSVKPARDGIFTWLVGGDAASRQIAVAHNTNLVHGNAHRYRGADSRITGESP